MAKTTKAEQLQKQAAGAKLWREIEGNCTGPLAEFREQLESHLHLCRYTRDIDDSHGRRDEANCQQAEALLRQIQDEADDHVGYGVKFPRTAWDACEPQWLTQAEAVAHIEEAYAPGYTSEPYVQLISISASGKHVVTEYAQGAWLDPLVAAGFRGTAD